MLKIACFSSLGSRCVITATAPPRRLAGAARCNHRDTKTSQCLLFILLDAQEHEVRGIANFSNVLRDAFHACFLGYSLGEKWQGQG